MITDYKRPKSLEEARSDYKNGWDVLGGGGYISKHQEKTSRVIDLQELGLSYCKQENNQLQFGAITTLQEMVDYAHTPVELLEIIKREKSFNIRNSATLAGTIVCADGRSDILAWLICSGANLVIDGKETSVIDYLQSGKKGLIEEIRINQHQLILFERISRTPDDFTMVGVCILKKTNNQKFTIVINGLTELVPLIISDIDESDVHQEVEKLLLTSRSQISNKWTSVIYQNKVINELLSRLLVKIRM